MEQLGSYRLRKRLAVGGMGEVYLGEKVGPEGFVKPVVLKCVLPQLAKDRAFVQLFLDEARLAALLNHPNIAQVYDFGLVDGVYYIAMEYVAGYTVDDIRRKLRSIRQFMPLQHIANIASQVCQGLHYAHSLTDAKGEGLGLVHRDVSPHNLIVSIDGSVKIVDFGIAKARAGLTRVQAKGAVGKFGYMSPEQARGEAVDGRSDLFSLGICLWELTTNERLHDPGLDRAPDYSPARPVRSVEPLRPEVPRQLTQILEAALAVEPADRFPSAQAMHLAMERFQAAMTHYAGQSALAAYIKDLVDGKVERGESDVGRLVEPASGSGGSAKKPRSGKAENMDAAQKYEEVFGVTMESKRGRPSMRSVPKSWETKPPSPAPSLERKSVPVAPMQVGGSASAPAALRHDGGSRELDLAEPSRDLPLDLARSGTTTARGRADARGRTEAYGRPAPASRGRFPWAAVVGLIVLLGLAGAAFAFRDRIVEWLPATAGAGTRATELTNIFRIESDPAGAEILLDGQAYTDSTPTELELIPDVDYVVEVRKEGYAPVQRKVTGAVSRGVQVLDFTLEKAGTLQITSDPPGAQISVDGVARGATPLTVPVPAGREVRIQADLKGRPAAVRSVQVPEGGREAVQFDL